jgi:hypothetical protein
MTTQTELSGEEEITKALEAMAANKNQNPAIEEQQPENTDDDVIIVDNEEKSEETDTSKLNDVEKEAYEMGWRPEAEFIRLGGNPNRWTRAFEFIRLHQIENKNKELQERLQKNEEESLARFESLNKFHKARNDFEIKEREAKVLEAVSNADTDEYSRLNKEIEELKNEGKAFVEQPAQRQAQTQAAPQLPPVIAEWREKNSWIKDASDPRSISANAIWDNYVKVNGGDGKVTIEDCLKHTEAQLKKLGIIEGEKVNPMRTSASSVENSRSPAKKTGQTVISMATIPHEMRKMWDNTKNSGMWKNEKEFLQSYADSLNQNNRR